MSSKRFIRVKVKYLPQLFQSITSIEEEELVLEEGSTLGDLLREISRIHGSELSKWLFNEKGLNEGILIVVNGQLTWDITRKLRDGDEIVLTIPFNGG
jgi:molybdopterin converting factor small subunit